MDNLNPRFMFYVWHNFVRLFVNYYKPTYCINGYLRSQSSVNHNCCVYPYFSHHSNDIFCIFWGRFVIQHNEKKIGN